MTTVPAQTRTRSFTVATASAGPFSVGFRLLDPDALAVYVNGLRRLDFDVDPAVISEFSDTAAITFAVALEADDEVVIDGNQSAARGADYLRSDPSVVAKLNQDLAVLAAAVLEVRNQTNRSLRGFTEVGPILDIEDLDVVQAQRHFQSRADAIASEVPESVFTIRVVHNGRVFNYYRITTNTAYAALTTNSGTVFWVPFTYDGTYDPAAWGDGWAALWNCWEWQKAALGRINMTIAQGQTYQQPTTGPLSERRLNAIGIPVKITGNRARLVQNSVEELIGISGGMEYQQSVIAANTVPVPGDDEEGDTFVADIVDLEVADTTGYASGDVIFVRDNESTPLDVDDNPVVDGSGNLVTPGIPSFPIRRRGEHAVVFRVDHDTNIIQLLQPLRFSYNLGAGFRIARMKRASIDISGLRLDTNTNAAQDDARLHLLYIQNAVAPRVENISSHYFGGDVVSFYGCHQPNTSGFTGYWGQDQSVGDVGGRYLIRNTNSGHGIHIGHYCQNARHLIDFLASNSAGQAHLNDTVSANMNGAGTCRVHRVTDCIAKGMTSASFSSHDGTEDIVFENCVSESPRNTSFGLRGSGNKIIDCTSINANIDIRVFVHNRYRVSGAAVSRNHLVQGFVSENAKSMVVRTNVGTEGFTVRDLEVRYTAEYSGTGALLLRADRETKAVFDGVRISGVFSIDDLVRVNEVAAGTRAEITLANVDIVGDPSNPDIQSIVRADGDGEVFYSVRNVRARKGDSGQLIVQRTRGSADIAVGSHVRDSAIFGIWSEDTTAPDRATVAAAYVSPDCNAISYRDGNALITLLRDATGTALSMADGSDWAPPHGVLNPRQFGTLGSGDDTTIVRACHVWANSKKLPVAYTGIEQVQVQSNALIPMQTSTDFAGCVIKAVGGIRPSPNTWSMSTAREMFVVTDPGTPLNTSTITPTAGNMAEGSRVPSADFFTLPGYAAIEVANGQPDTITDRQHVGVTGYLQPFRISAEGQSVNPLARNLAASTSINAKWRAMPLSGHLTIRGAVIDLSTMNNQKVFVVQRNDTSVESISFTGWNAMPAYHAHALLRFEDCCDITIRDVTGSALDNDPDSSSYIVSASSVAEVDLENCHFVDGWGAIGTNQIDGWRVHNCTLNRLDAHNGGGNIIVSDCSFKDIGVVIGWGWGSLQITNCRLINCPALSSRADYDGAWFMGSITIDGMAVQSVNFTQTILDWSTAPIGSKAGLSINLPGAIVVQNITGQRRPGAGTETRNIVPLSVTVDPAAAAVVSAQSVAVRNITNPNAAEVNNRWPALDLNAAGGVATEFRLEGIAARAKTSNAARATFLVPAVTGGRSPTGAPVNLRASNCDKLSISAPDAGSSSFEIDGCEVGRVQTGNRFVAISGCTFTDPAFFSPETIAPIGGTMAGTALYTSVMCSNVLAAGFDFSNVAALSGVAIRAATSPTLPAGATKATAFTGWLAAGF